MNTTEVLRPLANIALGITALPHDLVHEIILPENLVEHDFDVVGGVPVAVVVEGAGLLEHTGELDTAGAHVVDVGLGAFVPVLESALLLGLAPEHLVVAVGVERRVDVDEVHARRREFLELLQIVAAIDDTGVEQRGGLAGGLGAVVRRILADGLGFPFRGGFALARHDRKLAGLGPAGQRASVACCPHPRVDRRPLRYTLSAMRQVVIYPGEDGQWVAECPSLPGCISQGHTKEEAVANIREAVALFIETLEEDKLPVPPEKFETYVVAV